MAAASVPLAVALPICLMIGGCQFIPGTAANEKRHAQTYIAASLNDPSSAQFGNLDAHTSNGDHGPFRIVCGEVNGKNGSGAYAGFTHFFIDEMATQAGFNGVWESTCAGQKSIGSIVESY